MLPDGICADSQVYFYRHPFTWADPSHQGLCSKGLRVEVSKFASELHCEAWVQSCFCYEKRGRISYVKIMPEKCLASGDGWNGVWFRHIKGAICTFSLLPGVLLGAGGGDNRLPRAWANVAFTRKGNRIRPFRPTIFLFYSNLITSICVVHVQPRWLGGSDTLWAVCPRVCGTHCPHPLKEPDG